MNCHQDYKHVTIEGTRAALIVHFKSSNILLHSEDEVRELGQNLFSTVDVAARIDMPLLVSFRGVESFSSALIGQLVLVNKKARESGVKLQLCDLSPSVLEVFRRSRPGDGPAGMFAILKPPPKNDGGRANPRSDDDGGSDASA